MVLRGARGKLYQIWEDIRPSSVLMTKFILGFSYLAAFHNVGSSHASGVKNTDKISHFCPSPMKIGVWVDQMSV